MLDGLVFTSFIEAAAGKRKEPEIRAGLSTAADTASLRPHLPAVASLSGCPGHRLTSPQEHTQPDGCAADTDHPLSPVTAEREQPGTCRSSSDRSGVYGHITQRHPATPTPFEPTTYGLKVRYFIYLSRLKRITVSVPSQLLRISTPRFSAPCHPAPPDARTSARRPLSIDAPYVGAFSAAHSRQCSHSHRMPLLRMAPAQRG